MADMEGKRTCPVPFFEMVGVALSELPRDPFSEEDEGGDCYHHPPHPVDQLAAFLIGVIITLRTCW